MCYTFRLEQTLFFPLCVQEKPTQPSDLISQPPGGD